MFLTEKEALKRGVKKGVTLAKHAAPELAGKPTFKNIVSWIYVIRDLRGEEIVGTCYKKELQKTDQKEFRIEKVIKRKDYKLYVKC